MSDKLSTDPYKGVRDFYPEDQAIQNYIFDIWKTVAEQYGYEEYNASILEPAELYRSKTSDEIVNEQTYTFTDRGDRDVTLRPEMTPTVARMVAGKRRDLALPLRWYSIPNCFRYERPQRGRVREFWQLNADVFGIESIDAEVEMISLAYDMMRAFGAADGDFEIRINDRTLLQETITALLNDASRFPDALRLLDKKDKMSATEFAESWSTLADAPFDDSIAPNAQITHLLDTLAARGITNVVFAPTMTRGFDYYTGIVFEIFDTHPDNNRSLFGGGRYDRLLELFSNEQIPAVGFGMGDVTIRDFLETHGLLPELRSTTDVMVCIVDDTHAAAQTLAHTLRQGGINVAVYSGAKKLGDQIKIADKKHIPYVVIVGTEEVASGAYKLKELASGEEQTLDVAGIVSFLKDVRR